MNLKSPSQPDPHAPAASDDIRRLLGALEDRTIVEILALKPSLEDLGEAALWRRGDSDLIARSQRQLSAGAQAVIDILARDEEEWGEEER